MKKLILTTSICFALTTSMVLAASPTSKDKTSDTKQQATACPVKPKQRMTRAEMNKRFETKMAKKRALMYNALNLSEEQIKKAEEIHLKTKTDVYPLFETVRAERVKLNTLVNKKASSFEIWKQEHALKEARKQIEVRMKKTHQEFEAILTSEQKAKYKIIKEERNAKMKEWKKSHKSENKKHCKGNYPHCRTDYMNSFPSED